MGYFVTGMGRVVIPKKNLGRAYLALVELNRRDDLKTGGSFGHSDTNDKLSGSDSVASSENFWFSWMPWNYDEVYTSVDEIFEALGFIVGYMDNGDLQFREYPENKIGAERHFLNAVAPFVEPGSWMSWVGEDDMKWEWSFDGEKMIGYQE